MSEFQSELHQEEHKTSEEQEAVDGLQSEVTPSPADMQHLAEAPATLPVSAQLPVTQNTEELPRSPEPERYEPANPVALEAQSALAEAPTQELINVNQAESSQLSDPQPEQTEFAPQAARSGEASQTAQATSPGQRSPSKRSRSNGKKSGRNRDAGHRPAQVLTRLKRRPGVYRMYLQEAEQLLYHIRLTGLGPALALLLSQTEHKSKRRVYWDISKWAFKEQRLSGKNARSLMESVVYGESKFLMEATRSIVRFLEDLLRLSQQKKYRPEDLEQAEKAPAQSEVQSEEKDSGAADAPTAEKPEEPAQIPLSDEGAVPRQDIEQEGAQLFPQETDPQETEAKAGQAHE